jgi:hypothetical protein
MGFWDDVSFLQSRVPKMAFAETARREDRDAGVRFPTWRRLPRLNIAPVFGRKAPPAM